MTTFLHDDLLDPGANWCPICGEPRGVCTCDESDFMAEAADDWDDEDDWESEYGTCGCQFCYCGNKALAGATCIHCLMGEHQG